MTSHQPTSTAESLLGETFFVVEATSNEYYSLWRDWSSESDHLRFTPVKWEQMNPGWLVTVGSLAGRPCCISTTWARINGHLVMFWYGCSQVTDSVQTNAWLDKYFNGTWDNGTRRAWTDAGNFHQCMRAIEEENEKGGKK